jgi:2-oxoglutarate/2-oxoacid ferredoxin oxidoreductase subunit alpha
VKNLYSPITWLVGGEAGYGIATMGKMFARACARAGAGVFGYPEYPSLIRGGHNTAQVRFGDGEVRGHGDKIDVLVALNEETVRLHLDEMAEGGVIIYDGEYEGAEVVNVPFAKITEEMGGSAVMKNMVAFAASAAVCGVGFEFVESVIKDNFGRKGQEVVDLNVKLAKAGYEAVEVKIERKFEGGGEKQIVLTGNEAMALASIKAGLKFMAAYPMTPVTSIMQIIAAHAEKYGIIMKQTEDEIAAINMTVGAAHMGVRAMTATSGGGFSLMCEALGMAAMTETPIVVIEGTRPGPSTGLPTWTDQGDLRFVLHASQGEFPLVTALPGDVEECFEMTLKSYNLAEKYQMPCLLITDKYLGESVKSTAPFEADDYVAERGILSREEAVKTGDDEYLRFKITDSGVSPRALPGYPGCIHTSATDEHAENGDLDESAENRIAMVDKRSRKLVALVENDLSEEEMMELHGSEDAELTVVAWGSTKGPVLEAVEACEGKANFLQIKYASPFPAEGVERVLKGAKKILLVENNEQAQMGGMIREFTGVKIEEQLLRYDGRPVNAPEVLSRINKML